MAPGQDGISDTKERVPRDALFLFAKALPARAGSRVDPSSATPGHDARADASRGP